MYLFWPHLLVLRLSVKYHRHCIHRSCRGTNAISGITIVGALMAAAMVGGDWAKWLGFAALIVAAINVVGGFLVTDRMLQMFKKKTTEKSS